MIDRSAFPEKFWKALLRLARQSAKPYVCFLEVRALLVENYLVNRLSPITSSTSIAAGAHGKRSPSGLWPSCGQTCA